MNIYSTPHIPSKMTAKRAAAAAARQRSNAEPSAVVDTRRAVVDTRVARAKDAELEPAVPALAVGLRGGRKRHAVYERSLRIGHQAYCILLSIMTFLLGFVVVPVLAIFLLDYVAVMIVLSAISALKYSLLVLRRCAIGCFARILQQPDEDVGVDAASFANKNSKELRTRQQRRQLQKAHAKVLKKLKRLQRRLSRTDLCLQWFADWGLRCSVSYTHLTLPTNREV